MPQMARKGVKLIPILLTVIAALVIVLPYSCIVTYFSLSVSERIVTTLLALPIATIAALWGMIAGIILEKKIKGAK